jgi:aminoglycoside phosphotransferase (APT) family kinase protein
VTTAEHPAADWLVELGTRLLREARLPPARHTGTERRPHVVHGDWHLGQLARAGTGLLLLDVDDLGVGDPAWDLGRPAGFWAAGLLDDESWETFLDGYRGGGGPAVPATGDPWPDLDLAARCAVFVAAVREVSIQPAHSGDPADSLLAACARM